jgi:rRNA-processing protein FCF1
MLTNNKYIIDSNLLLLFIIGSVDNGIYIKKSKRLNAFTKEDYEIVANVLSKNASEVGITPYIAAEVSNLIDLTGDAGVKAFEFARLIFSGCTQIQSSIAKDTQGDTFLRFGITDNALIELANEYIIFTNDNKLLPALYEINSKNVLPLDMAREIIR